MSQPSSPALLNLSRASSRARSRSRRPPHSRNLSTSSIRYLSPAVDAIILPDGQVGEDTAELLQEFVYGHPPQSRLDDTEEGLIGVEEEAGQEDGDGESEESDPQADDREAMKSLPWYRRPSSVWFLAIIPLMASAMGSTIAPKIEIYNQLACRYHKPEYTIGRGTVLDDFSKLFAVEHELSRRPMPVPVEQGAGLYPMEFPPVFDYPLQPPEFPYQNDTKPKDNDDVDANNPNRCMADPEVQAAATKLTAAMTTTMGILSCLTTGWWGSFSDRRGRLRVMGISIIGLLITDINFIFVWKFSDRLPGGYWFLILGPIIEGLLGGLASSIAAMHGYVADCTEPSARSRVFSTFSGLLFVGIALGPTLGGLIIRFTGQTISVFFFATAIHFLYGFLVWFVIPESLSKRAMLEARRKRKEDAIELQQSERAMVTNGEVTEFMLQIQKTIGNSVAFLKPMAVFIPVKQKVGKTWRRDWNLTLLATSYGMSLLVMGSYPYKFQYAGAKFGWTAQEMGYLLTVVGGTRAFYLTVVLPLAIKFLRPKVPAIQLPVEENEPLNPSSTTPNGTSNNHTIPKPTPTPIKRHNTPSFDLALARFSVALECMCFIFLGLTNSVGCFTLISMLVSFGAGFSPAVQALSLLLYTRRGGKETGRLFGAMSVVQALCSQIIGPAIFGVTYLRTVATRPEAIFFVSAGVATISFISLSFVRRSSFTVSSTPDAESGELGANHGTESANGG